MFFIKLNYVNRKHKCICKSFVGYLSDLFFMQLIKSTYHNANISFFNYRKMMLLLQIMFKHCLFIVTVKQTQIIFVRMFCKNEISICNVEIFGCFKIEHALILFEQNDQHIYIHNIEFLIPKFKKKMMGIFFVIKRIMIIIHQNLFLNDISHSILKIS